MIKETNESAKIEHEIFSKSKYEIKNNIQFYVSWEKLGKIIEKKSEQKNDSRMDSRVENDRKG